MEILNFENVRLEFDGALASLVLADADRLNALSPDMVEGVQAALREIAKPRRGVRCLMVTGEGRGFCAGANLSRRRTEASEGKPSSAGSAVESIFHPMIRKLRDVEVPVVAAVNGACVGIGVSIALLADYVIAADKAYFLVPFRNLASSTDSGLTWLLPRAIGPARARQLVMRAERLPAETALQWGMINEVAPVEGFAGAARKVAQEFADGPTVALGLMRRLVQDSATTGLDAHMEAEARGVLKTSRTQDNATAIKAFGSKAPVTFVGS
ncbi:enoyl-CoA hydratase-related protein [Phenylobacterium sp.]|uniref:enoyl-CoA hydratase-related protein n=1 Tax=Phenylobacterium sp. TaxID=1871053 RepID=UPI002EDA3484